MLSHEKMGMEYITLGYTEVKKHIFHQHKSPILIANININKIIVSNKVPFGKKDFKYFVRYK